MYYSYAIFIENNPFKNVFWPKKGSFAVVMVKNGTFSIETFTYWTFFNLNFSEANIVSKYFQVFFIENFKNVTLSMKKRLNDSFFL